MSERRSRRKVRRTRVSVHSEESRPAAFCLWLSVLVASAAVAVSPWFLGGNIPHARLLLQLAAIVASVLSLLGCWLDQRLPQRLPHSVIAFLGLAALAGLQLLPIFEHPALAMDRAVFHELANGVPATADLPSGQGFARTVMPGETWLALTMFLTMALLAMVFVSTTGTVGRMITAAGSLVVSAVLMAVMGLSQQLGSVEVVVGNQWKISNSPPFGCFVNPNNAAGWMMISLSAALLCSGVSFGKTPERPVALQRRMDWKERLGMTIGTIARQIGGMTPAQIATSLACVLLLGAIAGTLSRAGIAAGCVGAISFFASRIRTQRWLLALCGMLLMLLLAGGFLLLLDLDTPILSELSTLKDPVSASTIRVVHWGDTLAAIFDFPLLGSGLGAYSYANLPYQRHFTGWWFEHADNQYFEVLVEAGLVGLLLYGLIAWSAARTALRLAFPGGDSGVYVRRRYADWTGSAMLCLLFSLAGQLFFDFSISLPAVLAALVMMLAIQDRRLLEVQTLAARTPPQKPDSDVEADAEPPSRLGWLSDFQPSLIIGVWLLTIVATAALVPDTRKAVSSYEAYAPARRIIDRPHPDVLAEYGDKTLAALKTVLPIRPEDENVQRLHVQLMRVMAQRELYLNATAGTKVPLQDRRNVLARLETSEYAIRYLSLNEPEQSGTMREPFLAALKKYPWREESRKLLARSAFVPGVASELFAADQFFPAEADEDRILKHVFFSEPHSARRLTALGHCLILVNREEEGLLCWQQSIADSEKFRADIFRIGTKLFGLDAMLKRFPLESFENSAGAAIALGKSELRTQLLAIADQLWTEKPPRLTTPIILLRADQLDLMQRPAEAFVILRDALDQSPEDLILRRKLATLLESNGLYEEAYNEWMRIEEFEPGQADTTAALNRLIKLPPKRLD